MKEFQFTKRVNRMFQIARKESKYNEYIIRPLDLFIGAYKEGTGVCSELYMYLFHNIGLDFVMKFVQLQQTSFQDKRYIEVQGYKVSYKTMEILQLAKHKMTRFNQLYVNEGHILSVILQQDETIASLIDEDMKQSILQIVSVPRDMTVNLNSYEIPASMKHAVCNVRRAVQSDLEELLQFVMFEFGERWIDAIHNGFRIYQEMPIYIAVQEKKIIGFACYDVVRGKKGLFGPMGIAKNNRVKGVGTELLHRCLSDMKQIGYEYAIIGQAGPIEFYEHTCDAKLIHN
ncbi:GNAT family N-acetyltransferase [Bacillus pseudomycoides]|uniref:GNAT family N-acetyltransferase n=1 Tax=Bacillus pseudomycoides TaxID=64104 RepID=UPI000BEE6154|nr:GNAT family N-acetyltransferase [Bacillus pseudomycoides]PDY47934.1 GNAT family N-acetyltransferase [Bacillus pseudomycoides]PFZ10392.1 GNAT family N-acetyltransferase [Bacillus pseudomycoides]PGC24281.1 GNAT family N-acetyltransferase [Bacillus pseudomycoides]PHB37465.1 GNAT family N-acetyltransferase [Bacillus pseudomycoides]